MGHKTSAPGGGQGSTVSYMVGFFLSLILTYEAYLLVTYHILSDRLLIAAVVVAAVMQLVVQLVFFLHLGSESKPRWNLIVFLFTLMVLVILVFGSLWIMHNLDYHMMSPAETDTYIQHEEGIKK